MSGVVRYLTNNIPLFAICVVILFIAFRNRRIRKQESILFVVFTAIVLFLSVVVEIEKYAQRVSNPVLGTIFTSFGYIFRPILLYIFVLLANMNEPRSKKFYYICAAPLLLNIIIYLFPLFFGVPVISKIVFYYVDNGDGTATFTRGTIIPLNFVAHAVCAFYLGVLVYVSTLRFQGKHRRDGTVIILCVAIILVTVAAEMIANRNDLLNVVCEICAMINYIFILSVNTSRDALTNLYDRRTFYEDTSRYRRLINGIISIDMNGLKNLNDNYGHNKGDNALAELARIFEASVDRSTMCVYRISGDEFVILMFQGKEEWLSDTVFAIKEEMKTSTCTAAIGSYFIDRKKEIITFESAMRKAEQAMYTDKNEYYKQTGNDRRKV